MKYNRETLIPELQKIEGVNIMDSTSTNNEIAFEWKGTVFLLSLQKSEASFNKSPSSGPLESEFSLDYMYRPIDLYSEFSVIDKYRITNFITAKTKNIASVIYRETSDSFQISAKYSPILEKLPSYKELVEQNYKKNFRYIILYLMSLCVYMSVEIASLISQNLTNDEKQNIII